MTKRKRSNRASARPRRPAPESDDDVKQSDGEESPPGTPDASPGPSTTEALQLRDEKDGQDFLREVEEYFKDIDPTKHDTFLELVLAQKHSGLRHSCFISQVKELFRGHTDMLKFFNEVLEPDYKILLKEKIQDLAKLYVAKVKRRSSPSVYTTFMHILYLYKERALPSDGVDWEVEVLFADSCDLLEEFDCFRPNRAAPVVQSALHPRHSTLEVSELQREQQSERLQRMCEDVAKRKRKKKGREIVTEWKQPPPKRVSPRLANASNALWNRRTSRSKAEDRHPERPTHTTPATVTEGQSQSNSQRLKDAKYIGRAMCTPSYFLKKTPSELTKSVLNEEHEVLQNQDLEDSEDSEDSEHSGDSNDSDYFDDSDDEVNAKVSVHRSDLAKSVLNEECRMVRKRSTGVIRKPNPYEKALFKCAKKQYDSDMVLRIYEATAESCMNYLLKLQQLNGGEAPPIEEFLSPMNKRCIKRLYGDLAQRVIKMLIKNPGGGLHILLDRLVLKLESLKSLKEKITPEWSQVYKNNFHLSLDHKSLNKKSKRKLKNINNLEAHTNGSTNPI